MIIEILNHLKDLLTIKHPKDVNDKLPITKLINNSTLNDQKYTNGFMNLSEYSVCGIKPTTKRKNHIIVHATDEDSAILIAKNNGLIEPFEVEITTLTEPSEAQLNYAKKVNINIAHGCCMKDVSALLTNYENNDFKKPAKRIINYATSKGLYFSTLLNEQSLYNFIFASLPLEDKIAFFCFSIYQHCNKDHTKTLDTSSNRSLFYQFASINISNDKFITSMQKYDGENLIIFGEYEDNGYSMVGGSKNTIAYKTAYQFLKEHNLLK